MINDSPYSMEVKCKSCGYIWLTTANRVINNCSECDNRKRKKENKDESQEAV